MVMWASEALQATSDLRFPPSPPSRFPLLLLWVVDGDQSPSKILKIVSWRTVLGNGHASGETLGFSSRVEGAREWTDACRRRSA